MASQASHEKGVRSEGLDADKAAQIDQVNALQIIQCQLVVEQLRKAGDLKIADRIPRPNLDPKKTSVRELMPCPSRMG